MTNSLRTMMEHVTHLLILGAPRSGTTLLTCLIGRHPEISLLSQDTGLSVKKLVGKKVVGNKLCVPNQIEIDTKRKWWKKIGIGGRTPRSVYSVNDYLQLPNPKIVAIIRNGNDVILSNIRRARKSFQKAAYQWCRSIEVIHALKSQHESKVMVLSFEDLVLDPDKSMRNVAEFLELEFQEQMLEGYKFNVNYPETEIVRAKALHHKQEKIDLELLRRFPTIYQKYKELLALIHSPGKSSLAGFHALLLSLVESCPLEELASTFFFWAAS